jgi:signal transduction histidine kinase/DNA-binding response OmpR family regulator/ligand-binding sensor domain-containing protein
LSLMLVFNDYLAAEERLLPVYNFRKIEGLTTEEIRSKVVRDYRGFIWFGTVNGLFRYDGYVAREYRNDPQNPYSLSSNCILSLLVDSQHRLWVGTSQTGLSLYDDAHDRFINFLPDQKDSSWSQSKSIKALMEDQSGDLWLAAQGIVHVNVTATTDLKDLESITGTIHFQSYPLGISHIQVNDLFQREDGKILVASDSGLIIFNPETNDFTRAQFNDSIGKQLDSIPLTCMLNDSHKNTWLGSRKNGVYRIDWNENKVWNYAHNLKTSCSCRFDGIYSIAEEKEGNIWISSKDGIYLLSPQSGQCIPYLTVDASLNLPSIHTDLSVDTTGTLWISFADGGVHWLSSRARRFPRYGIRDGSTSLPVSFKTVEVDKNGNCWLLSSKGLLYKINAGTLNVLKIVDIFSGKKPSSDHYTSFVDKNGVYWCGTWGLGLFRVDLQNSLVRNYGYSYGNGLTGTINFITAGSGNTLLLACNMGGIMEFDPVTEKFTKVVDINGSAWSVLCDRQGKIWISTITDGITIHDPKTGKSDHLRYDPTNPHSLSHDHVRFIHQDKAGRVWIGAGNDVDLWDPAIRSIKRYYNPEFSKSSFADPVGSDDHERVWIRFNRAGISMLKPATGVFTNFDVADGIGDKDMTNLADGKIMFIGDGGLNIFDPDSINLNRPAPPLVISRIVINNNLVPPPSPGGELKLSDFNYFLEFEFAAIDIDAPQLVRYECKLVGEDENWISLQDRRYVRYTNLHLHGLWTHALTVRAMSIRREWPDQRIDLQLGGSGLWRITIDLWAYVTLILVGIVASFIMMNQIHLKKQMKIEKFHINHITEIEQMKSRFFTNISHEFRTPLTLILGWIEKIGSKTNDKESQHSLSIMKSNAHQLLRLINQLLDLSKLEAGAMKLKVCLGNIVPVIKGVAYSFESSAGLRKIELNVRIEEEDIQIYFDKDKVEKILTNLLANAFKFTPDGGRIGVGIDCRGGSRSTLAENRWVDIIISDTGVGIPADKLPHIFNRFYQVDGSITREQGGTGIGLALVKELVEMHHGTISVTSQPEVGTEFIVSLPLGREHLQPDDIVEVRVEESKAELTPKATVSENMPTPDYETVPDQGIIRPIILVVEDNADVRQYIRENLLLSYQVIEAGDGSAGIAKALETIPDLIISDVMMPKQDGLELCRILKNDEKTSHIPIILLTAKAASENKIKGLQTGADDYLIKPFEPKELVTRVINLIELRRKLRKRFGTAIPLKAGEIAVTSMDDAFLKRAMSVVEQRMSDEKFDVEEFAKEMNMSRSQLHRKLTALTDQSAGDFIRYLRLQRALELLQKDAGEVSEIAYLVGFNDPSYFSKCFHHRFGKSPKEAKKTSKHT